MREVRVGMRINMKSGAEFFGLGEVNLLIEQGWSVLGVQEGALLTTRTGNDNVEKETVGLAISGFDVKLLLGEPAAGERKS